MASSALATSLPQYDLRRQKLDQQFNNEYQQRKDAIERTLAANGGGPSGAGLKLYSQASDQISNEKAAASKDLAAQELDAQMQLDAQKRAQEFATSERVGGQEFQKGILGQQQEYATGERVGAQKFQTGILGQQQRFQTGERQGSEAFAGGLEAKRLAQAGQQFEAAQGAQKEQFGAQLGQQGQQFAEKMAFEANQAEIDRNTTEFNKMISIMSMPNYKDRSYGMIGFMNDERNSPSARAAAGLYVQGINQGG